MKNKLYQNVTCTSIKMMGLYRPKCLLSIENTLLTESAGRKQYDAYIVREIGSTSMPNYCGHSVISLTLN